MAFLFFSMNNIALWVRIVIIVVILFAILVFGVKKIVFNAEYILINRPLNIFKRNKILEYNKVASVLLVKYEFSASLPPVIIIKSKSGMKEVIGINIEQAGLLYRYLKAKGVNVVNDGFSNLQ